MFCPKCGTENPDSAKFCKKCGAPFPETAGKKGAEDAKARALDFGNADRPTLLRVKSSGVTWLFLVGILAQMLGLFVPCLYVPGTSSSGIYLFGFGMASGGSEAQSYTMFNAPGSWLVILTLGILIVLSLLPAKRGYNTAMFVCFLINMVMSFVAIRWAKLNSKPAGAVLKSGYFFMLIAFAIWILIVIRMLLTLKKASH